MNGKSISARQTGILIFLSILSNKILLLPSSMFEKTKCDSIFILLIMFLLDILILPIFLNMKKSFSKTSLYDILNQKIGKFLTKLIYILFFIAVLFKIFLIFSVTYTYLKQQIYKDEFIFIALISLLPVINHAVKSGLRAFSRTTELFFYVFLFGFISCLFFSLFTHMSFPIFFESSLTSFFSSIYRYVFVFGDFIFLFFIIDKVDLKKNQEKILYKYSFLGFSLIFLLFLLFYAKYPVTSFMHNNAIADLLVFSIQFSAIGRLDIIALVTVMLITLFQLELLAYLFDDCFLKIFKLKNPLYSIFVLDLLFIILYYIFIGKYENIILLTLNWLPILGVLINYFLPFLFLIIVIVERLKRRKYVKNV